MAMGLKCQYRGVQKVV